MEFVRGLNNIKSKHRGCILAIGNFDGFHRGHQLLISKLIKKKSIYKIPIMVMLFEPQPKEYLSAIKTMRLTRLRDKIYYLCTAGVDIVLCITFNQQLASTEAQNFVENILIYKLGIRFICIGSDFRFGALRKGNLSLLKKIGNLEGFKVIQADTCLDQYGQKISSTAIKTALITDKIGEAELLLGHSYCISGKVMHGNKLGRTIGFPTANIYLQGKELPVHGVYAVEVHGILKIPLPGIANVGKHPTIAGAFQQQLEVHILNVSINLYCHHITVVILKKLRDEVCFGSIKTLQNQIQNDIIKVRNYFKKKYLKYKNGTLL